MQEATQRGGRAGAFAADFAQPGEATRLAGEVVRDMGPVDILVLNASIELLEEYQDISDETFDR